MKRFSVIAFTILMAASGCGDDDNPTSPPAPSNTIVFTSQLSAANEVPAITNAESNGRGTVTITFNVTRDAAQAITGGSATFVVNLSGFPAGTVARAAHIHNAPAGTNAGVFVDTGLTAANPVNLAADGTANNVSLTNSAVTAAQINAVIADPAGHYFNVHTVVNPSGAVRGQLVRQ